MEMLSQSRRCNFSASDHDHDEALPGHQITTPMKSRQCQPASPCVSITTSSKRQRSLPYFPRCGILLCSLMVLRPFFPIVVLDKKILVQAIPAPRSVHFHIRSRGGAVAPSAEHLLVVNKPDESLQNPVDREDSQQDSQHDPNNSQEPQRVTAEEKSTEQTTADTTSTPTTALSTTTTAMTAGEDAGEDVANKEDPRVLMLIRMLFLSYYSSLGALMPYLPVYYHSLGHGGQIIGMIGAVKPLTTFIVAPLWGIIADQTGNPFMILKATFLISLIGQLLVAVRHDHYYIMVMVFITALFNAPVKSLIDSMVMDHIKDQKQYGKLRLWGQMGFGLGSSAVGVLLSKSNGLAVPGSTSIPPAWAEYIANLPLPIKFIIHSLDKMWHSLYGYKLLFITHAALSIPTWIAIQASQKLDKEKEKQVEEVKKSENKVETQQKDSRSSTSNNRVAEGLWLLVHDSDALLFFLLVLLVGASSGCIENFAYVRMREVGGTGKEMGLSRLVSSIAGAPMFWFSGPLTQALGADRVLVLSLMSYITRFMIYALMKNPLHGLPAEALRGLTFAGFWSTATVYAHAISPPGLHATILMFLNAMYGGLGQSLGAIIGGKLSGKIGTVKTFIYSAITDFVFVCGLVVYLRVRKDSNFKNPTPIVPRRQSGKAKKQPEEQGQEQMQIQVQQPSQDEKNPNEITENEEKKTV